MHWTTSLHCTVLYNMLVLSQKHSMSKKIYQRTDGSKFEQLYSIPMHQGILQYSTYCSITSIYKHVTYQHNMTCAMYTLIFNKFFVIKMLFPSTNTFDIIHNDFKLYPFLFLHKQERKSSHYVAALNFSNSGISLVPSITFCYSSLFLSCQKSLIFISVPLHQHIFSTCSDNVRHS